MEQDRVQRKLTPPDVGSWNDQMQAGRLFRELIGDSDFNMTNTLITKDWRVWLIDFSRAFRLAKTLQFPAEVTRVDRKLLTNLRALNRETLQGKLAAWLSKAEIDAVIPRRDVIASILDKQIATKGDVATLYDLPRVKEACGAGLQPGAARSGSQMCDRRCAGRALDLEIAVSCEYQEWRTTRTKVRARA
jgi:hypothetical protein